MAEPGEFTRRAFLNGRIDLSRAEAVMDLISSRNEFSRKVSLAQLKGSLSEKVKELRSSIIYEIAFIESALDDPDSYDLEDYPERLEKICIDLTDQMNGLLMHADEGRILREGIRTVIVGKPNAGKSSLLNYMAGEDLAIVTDVAGTTRDTINESVRMNGVLLNLTDTAGILECDRMADVKIDIITVRHRDINSNLRYVVKTVNSLTEDKKQSTGIGAGCRWSAHIKELHLLVFIHAIMHTLYLIVDLCCDGSILHLEVKCRKNLRKWTSY
jgi:tRNA modification GTPase